MAQAQNPKSPFTFVLREPPHIYRNRSTVRGWCYTSVIALLLTCELSVEVKPYFLVRISKGEEPNHQVCRIWLRWRQTVTSGCPSEDLTHGCPEWYCTL